MSFSIIICQSIFGKVFVLFTQVKNMQFTRIKCLSIQFWIWQHRVTVGITFIPNFTIYYMFHVAFHIINAHNASHHSNAEL